MTSQIENDYWGTMLDVDAYLRATDFEALNPHDRYSLRARVIASTPLGKAALLVLTKEISPLRAFVGLLDEIDLAEVLGATALLEACLTLTNDWEMRGEAQRSSAILGVLLRVGLASAHEWLVVHSSSRLYNVVKRHPETARLGMDLESLRNIRRAWCSAELRSSGAHPVQLQPIRVLGQRADAPLHRVDRQAEIECFWGEIVMYERLVGMDEQRRPDEMTPAAAERAVLRLMEMYSESPTCGVEVCIRGLDLAVLWAMGCLDSAGHAVRSRRVAEYTVLFLEQLIAGGVLRAYGMLEDRLRVVLHVLQQRLGADAETQAFQRLLRSLGLRRSALESEDICRHSLVGPPRSV